MESDTFSKTIQLEEPAHKKWVTMNVQEHPNTSAILVSILIADRHWCMGKLFILCSHSLKNGQPHIEEMQHITPEGTDVTACVSLPDMSHSEPNPSYYLRIRPREERDKDQRGWGYIE